MPDCIVAHAPIIDASQIIVETKTETIIRDIGEQYEVRYSKPANSNKWTLPLDVLNQLSNLRLTIEDNARMLQPFCFESARAIQTTHDDGLTRPQPLSYIRSARLRQCPKGVMSRSRRFHECCGHMNEDRMCAGLTSQPAYDSPVWVNAPVTVNEIRVAFRHKPCLLCVFAKRRKEGILHWLKKAAAHKKSKLRIKQESPEIEANISTQLVEDQKVKLGEILYCDDVPVNPTSIGGKNYFFVIRDTKGQKIFSCLPYQAQLITSAYTKPSRSSRTCISCGLNSAQDLRLSYALTGSRPLCQRRVSSSTSTTTASTNQPVLIAAAERDIQTIVQNVAAAVHTNDFIRVSSWDQAVKHWTEIHGHTPLSESGLTPNQMLYQGSTSPDYKKHWIVDCNI